MTALLPRPARAELPVPADGRSVVGYDGSSAASVALQWAAQRARRSGTPLVVLSAVDDVHAVLGPDPAAVHEASPVVAGPAAEGAALARAAGAEATPASVRGSAEAALVGASETAESVVVAHRGRRARREVGDDAPTLGRVAFSVVDAATSPVVLVRGSAHPPGPHHPVVVGLDGSASSERAARFAALEAAAAGARLVLVAAWGSAPGGPVRTTAWHRSGSPDGVGGVVGEGGASEPAELEVAARLRAATAAIRAVAPALALERRTARGIPVEVLRDHARDAGLLVLGARGTDARDGRGGRLGLTALDLLTCAPCPVAVVR